MAYFTANVLVSGYGSENWRMHSVEKRLKGISGVQAVVPVGSNEVVSVSVFGVFER